MNRAPNNGRGWCIFPGYRWCGPGCNGPGYPTNAVDACCMRHDLCLQQGRDRCYCDYMFLECLRPYLDGPYPENRHARLMYHTIRLKTKFTCR